MLPQIVNKEDEEVVLVLQVVDEDVEAASDEAADVEEEVDAADPMAEVKVDYRVTPLDMIVVPPNEVSHMNEHAMAVLRSGVDGMVIGRGILVRIRQRNVAFNFVRMKAPMLQTRIMHQGRNRNQRKRLKTDDAMGTIQEEITILLRVKFILLLELHSMHSIFNTPVCDIAVVADEWHFQVSFTVDCCVSSTTRHMVVVIDLVSYNFCLELISGRNACFFGSL
jgi:hypothetical protein